MTEVWATVHYISSIVSKFMKCYVPGYTVDPHMWDLVLMVTGHRRYFGISESLYRMSVKA